MRRVIVDQSDDSLDNLLFHLARYKFISRLIKPSDTVIEIGCGSGYGARYLSDYARDVVAIDEEADMVEYAKSRFAKSNLVFDSKIGDRSGFDVVVCLEVIEHMSKDDGRKLLAQIKTLMAPGGVLFISTPRKITNPSENRKTYHVHEYEYEEYRSILEEFFARALVLTQIDEMVSTHNPSCAWNFVAVCYQ